MGSMTELKRDELEIAARAFAAVKADSLAGALVERIFMDLPGALWQHKDRAEESASELMRGPLKLALLEFTRSYLMEVEIRAQLTAQAAQEILDRTPGTFILHRTKVDKVVCPGCCHVHIGLNGECGVSMGGAGVCECKVEVTA